jgi:hypothetical protein
MSKREQKRWRLRAWRGISGVLLSLVLVYLYIGTTEVGRRFDRMMERRRTYSSGASRVQKAGGWEKIRDACDILATNVENSFFHWWPNNGDRRPLSAPLAALQLREIVLLPNSAGVPVMRLSMAGVHRTGNWDSPYYGVWVVCTNAPADYIPPVDSASAGMRGEVRKVADRVYEVR